MKYKSMIGADGWWYVFENGNDALKIAAFALTDEGGVIPLIAGGNGRPGMLIEPPYGIEGKCVFIDDEK